MKILFTSVGRRVELMQAFHHAAQNFVVDLIIIGVNITSGAQALQFCDKTEIVCRISDEKYIPTLLAICENEKMDCLIPTVDTDLLLLAENKHRFEASGTTVLVAKPEKVRICRDKNYTADYFYFSWVEIPSAGEFSRKICRRIK